MKIRVVSKRDEILTLNGNERNVHLAFRPANKDIFNLVESCPKIEMIQIPKSYISSVSKSIVQFLKMQKIALLEGDVWGHRKDINEYYDISSYVFSRVKELKTEGNTPDQIAVIVGKEKKLSPQTSAYVVSKVLEAAD